MSARLAAALALAVSLSSLAPAHAGGFARPPEEAGAPAEPAPAEPAPHTMRLWMPPEAPPRIAPKVRARLRRVLSVRRARNISAFRAYVRRGIYPHNFVQPGSLNVWIDEEGHMCAAATMIFKSGARALVRQVGREQNYIHLADVTTGPVMDWMLTSGLTQTEIATIQEPFFEVPNQPDPRRRDPQLDARAQEDARLRARYAEVLQILAADPDASLEAAIDRLAGRPDLIADLLTR